MSKQITAAELAEIVTMLLTNPKGAGELESFESYGAFMTDIAIAVADHCGGNIAGPASPLEDVWYVGVFGNECLSDNGGIWAGYDKEGELWPSGSTAPMNSRYAETIIGNSPDAYDALEVHGVRDLNCPGHPAGTACEVDDENPQFVSVYAHLKGGGVECVGDFATHTLAAEYAAELSKQYGWSITDLLADHWKGNALAQSST